MKKAFTLLLAASMLFALAACGGDSGSAPAGDGSASTATVPTSTDGTYEIALITDAIAGAIDDRSFTQGAWDGLSQYATENGISHQYYRSTEESVDGYLNAIQMAVENGAAVVVLPGYAYEPAVFRAQDEYPDVKFILLDGTPQDGTYTEYKTGDNTYSIVFAEEQAGWLAGYAAVMDGYRNLGFMGGMAVPAVMKYGYGFLQGAEFAAEELGLATGEVTVRYSYTGNFEPTPENQTKAASWYQSGTEVIFSCGGLIINSVTAAAEAAGGDAKVIGVDVDQKEESETIITSAMKMMTSAIYDGVVAAYDGSFPGGVNARLGADEDYVGLPDDFSRFNQFTREEYDAVYAQLRNDDGGLRTSIVGDSLDGETVSVAQITSMLTLVTLEEIN